MQSNHNFQKTRREANIRRHDERRHAEAIKTQKRKHKPSRFVPRQGWEL